MSLLIAKGLVFLMSVGMFLCLFLLIPVAGYFFGRALLKVMGLYSASPAQFRVELKVLAISGSLVAFTLGCYGVLMTFLWLAGPFD